MVNETTMALGHAPDSDVSKAREELALSAKKFRESELAVFTYRNDITGNHEKAKWLEIYCKEKLKACARLGDVEALRVFFEEACLEPSVVRALYVPWLREVVEEATPDCLPELISRWIEPHLGWPGETVSLHDKSKTRTYSSSFGACLASAMSRANGSETVLERAEALLSRALGPDDFVSGEDVHDVLGGMLGQGAVEDFHRILDSAGKMFTANPGGVAYLPTFASRIGVKFEQAFKESDAIEQGPVDYTTDRGKDWSRRGAPPLRATLIGQSRAFLRWCEGVDMEAGNAQSHYRVSPAHRVLGWLSLFARLPELAPELASANAIWGGPEGFVMGPDECDSQKYGFPVIAMEGLDLLRKIEWEGLPLTLVDIALFAGKHDSAKALISQGLSWSPQRYADLCSRLSRIPRIFEASKWSSEPNGVDACARALSVGEKCAIELGMSLTMDGTRAKTRRL